MIRFLLRRLLLLTAAALSVTSALAAGPTLLVVNQGDRTLSLIDVDTARETAAIPLDGVTGHEVAVSPDGRTAFVPIYSDVGVGKPGTDGDRIDVIDLASRKVTHTITFGRGVRPHCAVFNPGTGELYVTTELLKAISVIDPKTQRITGSIPTTQEQSHMLALSPDGVHAYTANVGPGTVSVLDLKARSTTAVIPISANTQRIAVSRDGRLAFTADQTKPQLAVIDTASDKVTRWVPLPNIAYGTATTPDGHWLLITQRTAKKVLALDLRTMTVAKTFDVPDGPTEILVSPDGKRAYVSCTYAGQIAVLNLEQGAVAGTIKAGKLADGLAWIP